jgi:sulfide:quinone oxidoreductase
MKLKVVVLGAGFGGLELSTILSETIGEQLDLTLIDQNDSFYFGFSKLDLMFGRKSAESVKIAYQQISKPGVHFRRERIISIDPESRSVETDKANYKADILVVALGADYDISATPGLSEAGNEFYSFEGAQKIRDKLPGFSKGHAIVGVTSAPFKCPPAPSEAALLLHDDLLQRGIRNNCTISLVIPFGLPIPPSPDTSKALLAAFAERDIHFIPNRKVKALDPALRVAILDDETQMPFDLFLGIPKHVVPDVILKSGLAENGWIPVDRRNMKTKYPNVYAIGDVTSVGTPKAGVFAEGTGRTAAESIIAEWQGTPEPPFYSGAGSCYVEFGQERVGRVDVDFFSGPKPTGTFFAPTEELARDKQQFGSTRKWRWFET